MNDVLFGIQKKINTAGACIALWLKRRKLMATLNWEIWVCRSLMACLDVKKWRGSRVEGGGVIQLPRLEDF